jgi:sec-independent protein translocase protein TatA
VNVGPWQLLIVAVVILVLFGRGRISEMMGDFGKGIKSFKQGMNEEAERKDAPRIEQRAEPAATPTPAARSADASPVEAVARDEKSV